MSIPVFLKPCLVAGSIAVLTSSILIGCGSSSSPSAETSQSYNGPGSKWDIQLADNGTFHIDHRPSVSGSIDYTVDGSYTRQANGFVTMTVTGGTGSSSPTNGSKAWAIEVPGYAFMLKPVDGDQLVAMVKSGECPTGDIDANWVIVKKGDLSTPDLAGDVGADDSSRDFLGTFHYDFASSAPTLPIKKGLDNSFTTVTGGGLSGTGSCADGIMTVSGAAMYLTSNGGALVHTDDGTPNDETDDSFIFALGAKAITNTIDFDGDFAGMLFDSSMSDGTKINPVALSCTSGNCTGTLVTDVEANTLSTDTVSIDLTGTVNDLNGTSANGFITGTITSGADIGNLACMVDNDANNSAKTIISCVGQSPGDNRKMFNVMFVSI